MKKPVAVKICSVLLAAVFVTAGTAGPASAASPVSAHGTQASAASRPQQWLCEKLRICW